MTRCMAARNILGIAALASALSGCSGGAVEVEGTEDLGSPQQELRRRGLWLLGTQDAQGTRYQSDEHEINRRNAARLSPRFTFEAESNISATPAVDEGAAYFPDFSGNLYKIDRRTGALIWSHKISEYTGVAKSWSRASPAISGDRLFIGDQDTGGAHLIAVDKRSGALLWITTVEAHPLAIVTQSPLVVDGGVFVGTSSREEGANLDPSYPCCSFRASVVSLDEDTGALRWQAYLVPDNGGHAGGYSGAAVWGGVPAYDRGRHTVYVATGNNYSVPQAVSDCLIQNSGSDACLADEDYVDSLVAIDTRTGQIKWGRRVSGADTFTRACLPVHLAWCPNPEGPDYDFASGVNLFSTADKHGCGRDLIGSGQKSGVYWALDRDSGEVVWRRLVGPGGPIGGIMWGSATDGQHVFVATANSYHLPHTLQPSGEITTGGSWSSLNASTGVIEWQTADPAGASDMGPVSAGNGVVYACSLATSGPNQYAFDARNGTILWGYASGASCNAGAAISDGTVYWGTGYNRFGLGSAGKWMRAFSIDARDVVE